MKDISKIIEEINALKAEDYKDFKSENHEELTEYERGFNAAVGLCLAILDEAKCGLRKNIETSEPIRNEVNIIINMKIENIRKACYLIFDQLYTDEQIIELLESRDVVLDTKIVEEMGNQFNIAICSLAIVTKLKEKETPKKSKFEERLASHQKKLRDALYKRK